MLVVNTQNWTESGKLKCLNGNEVYARFPSSLYLPCYVWDTVFNYIIYQIHIFIFVDLYAISHIVRYAEETRHATPSYWIFKNNISNIQYF